MSFLNFFNKGPETPPENLTNKIESEKETFFRNQEEIDAEIAALGGIQAITEKIEDLENSARKAEIGALLTTGGLTLAILAILRMPSGGPENIDMAEQLPTFLAYGIGTGLTYGGVVMIKNNIKSWLAKRMLGKLEDEKDDQIQRDYGDILSDEEQK